MPRQHKVDRTCTRMMLREKYFLDPRSFVSLPIGDDCESHVFLKGEDMRRRRMQVFVFSNGKCVKCGKYLFDFNAEMHHIVPRGKGGSDDIGNLEMRCADCHRKQHVRTRFGETNPDLTGILKASIREVRKRKAKEEFEQIYPEAT